MTEAQTAPLAPRTDTNSIAPRTNTSVAVKEVIDLRIHLAKRRAERVERDEERRVRDQGKRRRKKRAPLPSFLPGYEEEATQQETTARLSKQMQEDLGLAPAAHTEEVQLMADARMRYTAMSKGLTQAQHEVAAVPPARTEGAACGGSPQGEALLIKKVAHQQRRTQGAACGSSPQGEALLHKKVANQQRRAALPLPEPIEPVGWTQPLYAPVPSVSAAPQTEAHDDVGALPVCDAFCDAPPEAPWTGAADGTSVRLSEQPQPSLVDDVADAGFTPPKTSLMSVPSDDDEATPTELPVYDRCLSYVTAIAAACAEPLAHHGAAAGRGGRARAALAAAALIAGSALLLSVLRTRGAGRAVRLA
jgi:hypothetical protein